MERSVTDQLCHMLTLAEEGTMGNHESVVALQFYPLPIKR
jgi:hypothetical protein